MKVKTSELLKILGPIEEVRGFLIGMLDFADDDQVSYIQGLIESTRDIEDTIARITGK